ncbi:MAG: gamma-glutamyl-gamma-aminobutyrate hydrolase family protein [Clostridia bacterium]|nr:gamma-glutamyl-gamma-aminobutyrate hydrolase family protein [Clostridia bacterium]
MKKLVGVVGTGDLFLTKNSREDIYKFGNNYVKRITECGGIPLGILPVDGVIDEAVLNRFDSFLICGGNSNWPYHFQVVNHALKTGKPLLGICLGLQVIHRVFKTLDYMERTNYNGSIWDGYMEYGKGKDGFLLEPAPNHWVDLVRGSEKDSKHRVKLLNGSLINRLIGKEIICGGTFHHFRIVEPSDRLTISGYAEDGTVEVIEYGDKILGVQFHPEIDEELMPVFEMLCM